MARLGFSSGSLDGAVGYQTRAALRAFQARENLPITGELDNQTQGRLVLTDSSFTNYIVSDEDLLRLQPISKTWLGKSRQTALEFETILELIAEKSWSHPGFIRQLNPAVNWTNVVAGAEILVPRVEPPAVRSRAAFVRIDLAARVLRAFDARTNLITHFPCSIASRIEKRPIGELHVVIAAENPNYRFNPEVFPESEEGRRLGRPLILAPGPNNPVGVAWIGLDRAGYGIHGTSRPEDVGRTESHGCFRLSNWNAQHLLRLVWIGMPVYIEP